MANPDKQMDMLISISQRMEKSLSTIEKSLAATTEVTGKEVSILGALSSSIQSISAAVTAKSFDSKKANNLLDFTRGLVQISTSVNPEKAKSFSQFASGVSSAFTSILDLVSPENAIKLSIAEKFMIGGKNSLLKRIVGGLSNAIDGLDAKKIRAAGEAMKPLGEGLKSLADGMKSLVVVGIAAPLIALGALTAKGVVWLFSSFGEKAKSIAEGGKSLIELGKGLVVFSAGLATLTLALMIIPPGRMIQGLATIAAFGLTFSLIGQAATSISKGAKSVALMGLSLFGFSAGLATFMLTMFIVKPEMVLQGIATIAGFGVAFALLGKFDRILAQGALVLIGMSVALFLFSGGLMVYDVAMKNFDGERALLGAAIIAGLGVELAVLGKFAAQITEGSVVLGAMGVGLILFSGGLALFGLSMKMMDTKTAALGAAVILGLGLAFAGVGFVAPYIIAGAAAMGGIGLALLSISGGILAFGISLKLLNTIFKDDLEKAGIQAGAIILGLGLAFAGVGFVAPLILAGGTAMISVGIAMMSIAGGILVFGTALKLLQIMFKDDLIKAGEETAAIIMGLGLGFSAIGLISPFITLGAVSAILMGTSLLPLSLGLLAFAGVLKLTEKINLPEKIGIISDIGWEFAKLGNPFMSVPAILGAGTAMALGVALLSIGKGLDAASKAIKGIDQKFISALFDGQTGIIYKLAEGFSKIADKYGDKGLFAPIANILGVDPVSQGIAISWRMGGVISELAGGISKFADITNFPITTYENGKEVKTTINLLDTVPKVIDNFTLIVTKLAGMFASIGNDPTLTGIEKGASFWTKLTTTSPVQAGVKAVSGIGGIISELAGGISAFADLTNFPITTYVNGKEVKSTINVLDQLGSVKIKLADGETTGTGILGNVGIVLTAFAKMFAQIGKDMPGGLKKLLSGDSSIAKGIKAVTGIGSVVSDLASGITAFAALDNFPLEWDSEGKVTKYGKISVDDIIANVKKVVMSLPEVFESVPSFKYTMIKDLSETAAGISTDLKKVADNLNGAVLKDPTIKSLDRLTMAFQKLSNIKGFDKFAASFRMLNTEIKSLNNDTIKAFEIWTKTMSDFAQIDPEKFQSVIKVSGNLLENSFKSGQSNAPGADITTSEGKNTVASATVAASAPKQSEAKKQSPSITQEDFMSMVRSIASLQNSIDDLSHKFTKSQNGGILVGDR